MAKNMIPTDDVLPLVEICLYTIATKEAQILLLLTKYVKVQVVAIYSVLHSGGDNFTYYRSLTLDSKY
jgi:hypothetical protein